MINNDLKYPLIVNSSNYKYINNLLQTGGYNELKLDTGLIVDHKEFKNIIINMINYDKEIIYFIIVLLGLSLKISIYDVNKKKYIYNNINSPSNNIINLYKNLNEYYVWRDIFNDKPLIKNNISNQGQVLDKLSLYEVIGKYYDPIKTKDNIKKIILDYINNLDNKKLNSMINRYIQDYKDINLTNILQDYYIGDNNSDLYKYLLRINNGHIDVIKNLNDYEDLDKTIKNLSLEIKNKLQINNFKENNKNIITKINKKFNGIFIYSNIFIQKYIDLKSKITTPIIPSSDVSIPTITTPKASTPIITSPTKSVKKTTLDLRPKITKDLIKNFDTKTTFDPKKYKQVFYYDNDNDKNNEIDIIDDKNISIYHDKITLQFNDGNYQELYYYKTDTDLKNKVNYRYLKKTEKDKLVWYKNKLYYEL